MMVMLILLVMDVLYLHDPDIALKVTKGECIRECLNCNKGCVDAIQNRNTFRVF